MAAKARQTTLDRTVVPVGPIAGERRVVLEQAGDVVGEMRPLGLARDLGLLPGRQLGIGLAQQALGAGFEPADLLRQVELVAAAAQVAQLLDLAFQLADRFLEIEQLALLPQSGVGWRLSA
jgi:hypothetical protein